MSETTINKVVYARDTIEFVTIAVQFCAYLEKFEDVESEELVDRLTKLLPLLYIKAQLIPTIEEEVFDEPEMVVTEEDYNFVRSKIAAVLGAEDTYLEVFLEDMKYSETPILSNISENVADIYQDLRNFITIYERGIEEQMLGALSECVDNFRFYWGQTLVNVLRALHYVKYNVGESDDIDDESLNYTEEEWL